MNLTLEAAVRFINASLAPAVMFTGVGLLLAGLQSKYSTIVSVIRQLNTSRLSTHNETENKRTINQIDSLMHRARLIRNAVCSFYLTVFFLLCSSLLIGLIVLELPLPTESVFIAFSLALGSLFTGLFFATWEALLSYHIVKIEASKWET